MQNDAQKKISALEEENRKLKERINSVVDSPYLRHSLDKLVLKISLRREEIVKLEFGKSIQEFQGSLFEIKELIRRYAPVVGVDPDSARISATEALQNIIEHGDGPFAEFMLEINNSFSNPYLKMSFKHEVAPGKKYTLTDMNKNALKGDITSETFDFESARGRGEFIMKELSDERRILNGVEVLPDGRKIHYFQRILINYKHSDGARAETSFDEIREEIGRLDNEDVVCYFHLDHKKSKLRNLTVAIPKTREEIVKKILTDAGFELVHKDTYYRCLFLSFVPENDKNIENLDKLFQKIRKKVETEAET
ncbi:ATP-binding protein [Leptospira sp. GIMC2001]|uniref:ATP-binding protein n=1 Tax=Leptospira sp. GIMC2001 TaxID=1513297 RepID=UPI00234C02AD|nr:ATP-binding protein [Leptospira sp. GIMC2001]WCL47718.1 ATP-binding protein [Leptospira sp. GIMC2001]